MPTLEQARSWYRQDDPVHGFDHIVRVYRLAERLALQEGADVQVVRAAALLHDAGDGPGVGDDGAGRQSHQHASAAFAEQVLKKEGWSPQRIEAVVHCILAHRFRDESQEPASLEAQVLFDADKLDAIGATGVARAVAYAARAGQPAYNQPCRRFLQTGEKEPGEGHSAYHEHLFKLQKIKARMYTASGRAMAEERHRYMVAFFERLKRENQGEC